METRACLSFVVETLSKVEIMVKILQRVARELYNHNQEMAPMNLPNVVPPLNGTDQAISEELTKSLMNINPTFHLTSAENLAAMLNLYVDNTIIASDSILSRQLNNLKDSLSARDSNIKRLYLIAFDGFIR